MERAIYHSRKYLLNEDFFDKWTTAMAYVLGFWFADGYMRHEKSYRISFFSSDLEVLEQIRGAMSSTNPIIRQVKTKAVNRCYQLTVRSRRLYEKLVNLGGLRNKSRVLLFPNIPNRYLHDFIRGYFDGDGSVHEIGYRA